jgi:NAD(P)-dependent dehydrogenase (short-subunit alcohol dehydrogenase family)
MRLQDKVAVVTGAGSGMGRAIAILFAQEGAKVIAGEWNQNTLDEVVVTVKEMVKGTGADIVGVKGNVAVQAEAESLVDAAISNFGRIDILCNNAGVMDLNQGVGELSEEIWRRVLGINLDGPMFASRRAVPHMVAQGSGSIINVASTAAISGAAAGVAYTASKHAVAGLTKNTAWVYGPKGVRCNAIAPGGVATNITSSVDMSKFDPYGSQRMGVFYQTMPGTLQPLDIANLALFLASDESKMINGAIIPADAGWLAT